MACREPGHTFAEFYDSLMNAPYVPATREAHDREAQKAAAAEVAREQARKVAIGIANEAVERARELVSGCYSPGCESGCECQCAGLGGPANQLGVERVANILLRRR